MHSQRFKNFIISKRLLTNVVIDLLLAIHEIFKRGLKTIIKIVTLLLAVGEIGLRIPTLLRTAVCVIGSVVPNGFLVLLSERARFARVSSIATFLTCHLRLHSLVNLLMWRFQLFHEKIHLGCQRIDTVNFMYSFCMTGCLSSFQLWLEATLSMSVLAPATSRERNAPPATASM